MADNGSAPNPLPPAQTSDPFASAKANLRDTVKWLATTFAALAAAVLAGTSLTGISGLTGLQLVVALAGGAIGLICVFLATGTALRLLTSESFFLGQLDADTEIKRLLNEHAVDVLPPEFPTLDEFLRLRSEAIAVIARSINDRSAADEYRKASDFFASLEPAVSRLVNLAHFEVLRRNLKRGERPLFFFAIGALVGLGIFAVFTGSAKKSEPSDGVTITDLQLVPGKGWSDLAKAFTDACGDAVPLRAQLIGKPQPGWVELRFVAPEACAGLLVTVPARVVAAPTPPPSRSGAVTP